MTGTGIQDKVMEAVVIMNAAIINLRLYPPTNAMIIKTIERLSETFQNFLQENGTLLLAESENNLLITGEPLTEKNRQKPQVAVFLMLMANRGIKSVLFSQGLEKNELSYFLEMLGKKQDGVTGEEELGQIFSEEKTPHIRVNAKRYVEVDQDRQIMSSLDIKDADLIRYIANEHPDVTQDPEKLKELAKDRGWVSRIFQSGMQHLAGRDGMQSGSKLSESVLHMLRALDEITDRDGRESLSMIAAKSISDMDADLIAVMMSQNMDGLLENRLFDHLVDRIDHGKLEEIAFKLYQSIDAPDSGGGIHDGATMECTRQAYRRLTGTDKGAELRQRIEARQAREKEERGKEIREQSGKINDILDRLEQGHPHESDLKALTELLGALSPNGETVSMEAVIERLIGLLEKDRTDVRTEASEALAEIFGHLSPERRMELLARYVDRLTAWMKSAAGATGAFGKIGMHLKDLAEGWIRDRRFKESLPLLEAFSHIVSNRSEQNDPAREAISGIIKEIASPGALGTLIEAFRTDAQNQGREAGRILVAMAGHSVDPLMDILMKSEISEERILILNLIPEMGSAAVPAVAARITESTPWHGLRNLARVLGRIGNEEDAKTHLAPLLVYGDLRVQKEAFKSINSIGGASRGEIFLRALAGCDDQLKANLAAALGSLKCRDAVKALISLFKSKTNLPEEMRVELQEKICIALGNIGDREAVPFLKEVSRQSGLFGFKSHHVKVKAAAGRALGAMHET
jgi:HEAT repeat protein